MNKYLGVLLRKSGELPAVGITGGDKNIERFLKFAGGNLLSNDAEFPLITGTDLMTGEDRSYFVNGLIRFNGHSEHMEGGL